jgi:hypothetical protein
MLLVTQCSYFWFTLPVFATGSVCCCWVCLLLLPAAAAACLHAIRCVQGCIDGEGCGLNLSVADSACSWCLLLLLSAAAATCLQGCIDGEERGLVPQAIQALGDGIEADTSGAEFEVRMTNH